MEATAAGTHFGRWGDDPSASPALLRNITVTPGDGRHSTPSSRPAITVYDAKLRNLIAFTQTVSPAGAGTMTAMPAPQAYSPAPDLLLCGTPESNAACDT